jgi:hypothetical protein
MRASISCPTGGKVVSFQLPTDAATVAKCWKLLIRMECPHCGELHTAPFKDPYVDGLLNGVGTMPQTSFFSMLPDAPKRKVRHAEHVVIRDNTERRRWSTTAMASIGHRERTHI